MHVVMVNMNVHTDWSILTPKLQFCHRVYRLSSTSVSVSVSVSLCVCAGGSVSVSVCVYLYAAVIRLATKAPCPRWETSHRLTICESVPTPSFFFSCLMKTPNRNKADPPASSVESRIWCLEKKSCSKMTSSSTYCQLWGLFFRERSVNIAVL